MHMIHVLENQYKVLLGWKPSLYNITSCTYYLQYFALPTWYRHLPVCILEALCQGHIHVHVSVFLYHDSYMMIITMHTISW